MSKHTRRVTHVVTRSLAFAALAALPLLVANACSNEERHTLVSVGESGRLQLNLTGISNTNLVYQLRNATFTITGVSSGFYLEVNTETEPNRASILLELPPGSYEVFLQGGYYLERLPGAGAPSALRGTNPRASADAERTKPSARTLLGTHAVDGGVPPPDEPPPPPPDEPPPPPDEPPPSGVVVDATLISPNPALITITPLVVSPIDFVFQVGGDVVQTGNGVLDIGISVIDNGGGGGSCQPDAFEPNDDLTQASPITPGQQISASLCELDVDNFIFPSPVAAGEAFSVVVAFQNAAGDIDAALLEAETGIFVASSAGVTDSETLVTTSNGGSYILQTYLFSDPDGGGNQYSVDMGSYSVENGCCEESQLPGCSEPDVLACVCESDSYCCEVAFDSICVSLALTCGTSCDNEGAESNCCSTSGVPGCTDQAVHDCMCRTDISCCTSSFDDVCVSQAIAECGAACPLPPPVSDCCSASSTPGCTVAPVQACVCEIDPYCCTVSFDENCAALASAECEATCQF